MPFHFRQHLKEPQAQHPPNTSCDSQVSTTIHISLYLGPEAPLAEPQACVPSLPMRLPSKTMFVTVLLTFNASARACGRSDGKLDDLPCGLPGHWWLRLNCYVTVGTNKNSSKDQMMLKEGWTSAASKWKPLISFFSHFEHVEIKTCCLRTSDAAFEIEYHKFAVDTIDSKTDGIYAQYSKRPTKSIKLKVTIHRPNTCPTPLKCLDSQTPSAYYIISSLHSEPWSHGPPCWAPGLCSFIANSCELLSWSVPTRNSSTVKVKWC